MAAPVPDIATPDAPPALVPMGGICGKPVTNAAGEKLGVISELMVDTTLGIIVYAVLNHGGLLGVGEKLFAVPWSRFTVDAIEGDIRLDVPSDLLDELPGFDKDAWPTEPDPALARGPGPAGR